MNTRCKFVCNSVTTNQDDTQNIHLSAVVSGSPENESFFKFTPAGSLILSVVNKNVKFEVDKEYYLDISPA